LLGCSGLLERADCCYEVCTLVGWFVGVTDVAFAWLCAKNGFLIAGLDLLLG